VSDNVNIVLVTLKYAFESIWSHC